MSRKGKSNEKKMNNYLRTITIRNYSKHTITQYASTLRIFINFLRKKNINSLETIDRSTIYSFIFEKYTNSKKITRRKQISISSSFFYYLCEIDEMKINPCIYIDLPKKDKISPRFMVVHDVDRILVSIEGDKNKFYERNLLIISLLYGSGLRVSELCKLSLSNVDYNRAMIRVKKGKGQVEREVPMTTKALYFLNKYLNSLRKELHYKSLNSFSYN